jgi:hypothetical protein
MLERREFRSMVLLNLLRFMVTLAFLAILGIAAIVLMFIVMLMVVEPLVLGGVMLTILGIWTMRQRG